MALVALDDTAETTEDVAVEINVLANDSDLEDELLTVTIASQTTNGVVSVDAAGVVTYQPDTGYSGSDSFVYTLSDSDGGSNDATESVTINGEAFTNLWSNNLPIGTGGTYEIRYNSNVAWSHFEINGSN